MRTVWLIIGIHVTVLGCAFVFAGFTTLVTPSEAELETTRQACEGERRRAGGTASFILSAKSDLIDSAAFLQLYQALA